MRIIIRRFMSVLLMLCFISSPVATFALESADANVLPEVKIVSPNRGSTISVGYEMGINNPYGTNSGAPIDIKVELQYPKISVLQCKQSRRASN
ncbi:MAG TPA: hypothetical protein VIO64_20265 [Pseudobacteroides sp.]|uniref:hypothetical protein n=1 Tax=Pseudobacteroides sp. TaxID=1968840 RepID=UPI002F930625